MATYKEPPINPGSAPAGCVRSLPHMADFYCGQVNATTEDSHNHNNGKRNRGRPERSSTSLIYIHHVCKAKLKLEQTMLLYLVTIDALAALFM